MGGTNRLLAAILGALIGFPASNVYLMQKLEDGATGVGIAFVALLIVVVCAVIVVLLHSLLDGKSDSSVPHNVARPVRALTPEERQQQERNTRIVEERLRASRPTETDDSPVADGLANQDKDE